MNLKALVSNLANRINQAHHLEIELQKVFLAGVKYAQEKNGWISTEVAIPPILSDDNHSGNVLAIVDGIEGTQVMCLVHAKDENDKWCYIWANAYGNLQGEAQFDDDYNVLKWQHIPKI